MSPLSRSLAGALVVFTVGAVLNLIALRRGWTSRFNWLAAVITPIGVGLLLFLSAP